ncbi:MAG: PAS domain S-box protein [Acidimicrobiia bacterium]|nr:PAS domain S-box protein [Acidimicrobiia bacterium]
MGRRTSAAGAVIVFTALLASVALGAAAVDAAVFGLRAMSPTWLPVWAVVLCAGASFQIRFRYRDDVEALDLFEAALMPVLFLYGAWIVVAVVAGSNLVAELLRRNTGVKGVFNVSQWAAAAGVGGVVYSALRHGNALSAHNVAALAVSLVVVLAVNHFAVAAVVALAQGHSVRSVLSGFGAVIVPGWIIGGGLNLAFGLIFVAASQWSMAITPLFLAPLAALNWAGAAFAAARADEVRLQALHSASAVLSAAVDPLDAMDAFLDEVRACFEAEGAEISFVQGDGYVTHRVPASQRELAPALVLSLLTLTDPARLKAQSTNPEGWRDCLAAPLIDDGVTIGVLCTYNRTGLEGFEDGELSVLSALAADVVAALQRGALVQRVVEERRKLRDIVGQASDGIFTMSIAGTVSSWNPAMEEITGYCADDVVGRAAFGLVRPRDIEGGDVMLERWAVDDVTPPADLQILTMAGERRWLSCSYSRAAAADGIGQSLIVIARDVTKLREVERLREEFVAIASHELRTPLSPIKGWASTLLQYGDTMEPEERKAAMESILRQSQRLERLIVNLLEASKIEHGMFDAADGEVDVAAVTERVVGDFAKTSPDRAFEVTTTGPAWAHAKELAVETVVTNLVSNAVKYSEDAESIEVSICESDGRVRVAVTDHGCGIPAHELERVFERFHRVRDTTTQTGTGLGLYIARRLATEMDGSVAVESSPGRGSTFVLDLPAIPTVVDVRPEPHIIELEAG